MSELDVVQKTSGLVTKQTLRDDFQRIGLKAGMILLVHSSLSRLGWVCGGAVAVIEALIETLTPGGTLMMPLHSGDLSDPAPWQHPSVPNEWHETIRETMPAFRKDLTPTRSMGVIAETFRKMDGVIRSDHPQVSFGAFGKQAEDLVKGHSLEMGLGENSPLARLYDFNGSIFLLGIGHENNTSMHLAEHRAQYEGKIYFPQGAPILVEGHRSWKTFNDLLTNSDDFEQIGKSFDQAGLSIIGQAGCGKAILMKTRILVDFTVNALPKFRGSASKTIFSS